MQDLFDISDDVGTKLFPFKDQDQPVVCNDMPGVDGLGYLPSMGSVRSGNGVKQGIIPLADFKRKTQSAWIFK